MQSELFLRFSLPRVSFSQKNPFSVHKIRVRNSGAGTGCTNFMDAWKKCVLSAGKPVSIQILVLGGGLGGGGGKCRFYFYGREDFSDLELFRNPGNKILRFVF